MKFLHTIAVSILMCGLIGTGSIRATDMNALDMLYAAVSQTVKDGGNFDDDSILEAVDAVRDAYSDIFHTDGTIPQDVTAVFTVYLQHEGDDKKAGRFFGKVFSLDRSILEDALSAMEDDELQRYGNRIKKTFGSEHELYSRAGGKSHAAAAAPRYYESWEFPELDDTTFEALEYAVQNKDGYTTDDQYDYYAEQHRRGNRRGDCSGAVVLYS
ncbi:MAG: hypothetical protein WCJ17_00470 [bacterium]